MNDSVQAIQESYTRIKLLSNDVQIKDQTINILQERLQELEEQLSQAIKQKEYGDRQFGILQEEHDQMFDNQQKKTKQLQQFNQQLLAALKEVQDKNQELLEKVKFQSQELSQKQMTQQEVTEQISLIKDAVKGLEDELQQLTKKNSILKKEKQEAETQLRQITSEKNKFENSIINMLKQLETENELLKQELEDYRLRLEQQHQELVELKYVKISFEDLEKKNQQLNEQFNIQVQTAMECEKNYALQFDEMNRANEKLRKECEIQHDQYKQQKDYSNQLEQQNKEFSKLFNYIQQQIDETIAECLVTKKKSNVYERLYEGRKSSSATSRKSVPKKKKKYSYNQIQIEEFFIDIKEIIQSLISTNTQLKEENDQVCKNIQDMHKVGEQLRYKIEQLNSEHIKARDQLQLEHQNIIEQQEDKINQLQDALEQQNLKAQKDHQYIDQLIESCHQYDQQILEKERINQQFLQQKQDLAQEFEELNNQYIQLQVEFEELLVRKAISQNKVALSYSLLSYLLKNKRTQFLFSQLIQYSNYIHYFVLLRNQFQIRNQNIYLRFRKVAYAIIFVKKLKKALYIKDEVVILEFDNNEIIDQTFEKFIPILHDIEEGKQTGLNIVNKMIKELNFQINKYDLKYQGRSTNSQNYYQILNFAKEDIQKKNSIGSQIDYYQQQLSSLQTRVYQLDEYVQQLEQELSEKVSFSTTQQQQVYLQQSEEQSINKFRTDSSPPQKNNLSVSLQNELMSILSKKSSANLSKAGQIVKQGL
ncbi:unnamed protein product (macronuclear) [Paramecium tetraurelia]|uniref:Uncharacterized protein n=1 Tax=Paramecium tetraurelia TaxID=5888 RepID=A0EFE5_PARTE|nr:uncharacterized protein GSPATT00026359001 [Paramecium tetraurelia]CAK94036.1 unnamed protein product [Paramecium tetraurelia]|eukprot:XP_001461409.1 hypothetical protein (macronuclear) [Paramecium tetraurelia strain d4-2]